MRDYRTRSRTNQLMTDIAKALEETAIVDVAACYAAQPRRNPKPVTPTEPPATIVQLIEWAIQAATSLARLATGGVRAALSRRLTCLSNANTALQLKAYASGERQNNVYGRRRLSRQY